MGSPDHKAASTSGTLVSSKVQARAHSPHPEEGRRHNRPGFSSTLGLQSRCGGGGGQLVSSLPPHCPSGRADASPWHFQSLNQHFWPPTQLPSLHPTTSPDPAPLYPSPGLQSPPLQAWPFGAGTKGRPIRAQAENTAHSWERTSIPHLPLHLRHEGRAHRWGLLGRGPPPRLGHQGASGEEGDSPQNQPLLTLPSSLRPPGNIESEAQNREPETGKRPRGDRRQQKPAGPWRTPRQATAGTQDSAPSVSSQRPPLRLASHRLSSTASPLRCGVLAKVSRAGVEAWTSPCPSRPDPHSWGLGFSICKMGGIECSDRCPILGKVRGDEEETERKLLEVPEQTDTTGTRPHQPQLHPRGEKEEELPAVLPGLLGQEVLLMPRASCPTPTRFPGASASHPRTKAPGSRCRGRAQPHCPLTDSDRGPSPTPGGPVLQRKAQPLSQGTPRPLLLASLPLHSQCAWRVLPGTPSVWLQASCSCDQNGDT